MIKSSFLRVFPRICAPRFLSNRPSAGSGSEDLRSVLQKQADIKESWIPADDSDEPVKKLSPREMKIEEDKKRLQWRLPIDHDDTVWKSKFSVFVSNETDMSLLEIIAQPWDLTPKNLKRIYAERKLKKAAYEQSFIPMRHEMLGPDLAIAHFILHRHGKIKFRGEPEWTDNSHLRDLPNRFDPRYVVEAVNFDGKDLHYEGCENFRDIPNCRSISLRNSAFFDDWCLDRISGCFLPCLEELDISGTDVSDRGMGVIYRMSALKRLIVDKEKNSSIDWQLSFAMLEEMNPNLRVLDCREAAQT